MATVELETESFRTKKQQQLIAMLNDKSVQKYANTIIKDAINEFVPIKTGALRRSAIVTHKSISWGRGLKYARYQYGGEIYGPNLPGAINGSPAWRSRRGMTKHPTGRMMGDFTGIINLKPRWQKGEPKVNGLLPYKFGYTKQGTHHHWDQYFTYQPKMKANLEITQYLKRECKARGLRT